MVSLDSNLLRVDPAQIALGNEAGGPQAPDAESPACAASLSAFQSALVFKNIFTSIMAILATLTLGVLAFCLIHAVASSWDATNTLAAIAAVVTGGGAVFLGNEKSKAEKVLNEALSDVQKYCGTELHNKLT